MIVFAVLKKRLEARILTYLMLGVAIFGLLMGYYVYRNSGLRLESETRLYRIHGNTVLRNFSTDVTLYFGLQSGNTEVLKSEAKKLFEDNTVSYVVFYGGKSELIYESYREGLTKTDFVFPVMSEDDVAEKEVIKNVESVNDEPFLDFSTRAKMAEDSPGDYVGWVRIGISLETLYSQVRRQKITGFALIGLMLGIGLFIVLVLLRSVMPPVNRLARAAREFGQGNYDVAVDVSREDEIGLLTKTFNEMVENIRSENERSRNLIINITDAIRLLTDITEKLRAITTDQSTGTTEQSTIVQEVVSTTGEIAVTASNIASAADSVNSTAEKTSGVCYKGKDYIQGAIGGMNQINAQVEKVTQQALELSGQAQQISGVIEIIEEISGQTNLLALNAALEAAGAGEAGKRFSVVAAEVRRLASRTLEFTESVKEVIENTQKATGDMVMTAEKQQKMVEEGTEAVQRMGEYFEHILNMVDSTLRSASEISLITKQQSTASDQMVASIRGVEEVAEQVESGSKEIEKLVMELKTLADHLQAQIEEKDDRA